MTEQRTPLDAEIRARIARAGPIPVAEFMARTTVLQEKPAKGVKRVIVIVKPVIEATDAIACFARYR